MLIALATVILVATILWLIKASQELNKKIRTTSNIATQLEKQRLDDLSKQTTQTEEQKKQLQQEIDSIKSQLQSKIDAKAKLALVSQAQAAIAPVAPAPVQQPQQPVGDPNSSKMFIYMHESGNSPGAINKGSGACGLGQALPCSKLPCSLSDYACQDNWFTQYCMSRYGSWASAEAFWRQNHWW